MNEETKPTQEEFELFINTDKFRQALKQFADDNRNKDLKDTDKCKVCRLYRVVHDRANHEFELYVSPIKKSVS